MKAKLYNNKIVYFEWQDNIVYCYSDINVNNLPMIEIANPPEDWLQNWNYYDYVPESNKYIFNEQLKQQEDRFKIINELRQRREIECFSIIDRSKLWYDSLTTQQYNQLMSWYQAWLNAPQTGIIPEKPQWL